MPIFRVVCVILAAVCFGLAKVDAAHDKDPFWYGSALGFALLALMPGG